MKTLFMLIFLIIFVCLGCASCGEKLPTPPSEPSDTHLCGKACDKMLKLGCEEGTPVPIPTIDAGCIQGILAEGGAQCLVSCEEFCIDLQHNSRVSLQPSCILEKVTMCSEIESLCAPTQ
jgi:hypothetical protein